MTTAPRVTHLARRFLGSLRPGGPRPRDARWVESVLLPDEHEIWKRLSNADRRHSVAVARRVQRALTDTGYAGDSRWLAAALLHDVGKLDAGLGTLARVGATLAAAAAGRDHADTWSTRRGFTRRVSLYLRHPELGEARIRAVGGRDEAARWAGAHHEPTSWSDLDLPSEVLVVLRDADDD